MRRHCRDPIARVAATGKKRAARARDSHLLASCTALYRALVLDGDATIVCAAMDLGYGSSDKATQAVWMEAFSRVLAESRLRVP